MRGQTTIPGTLLLLCVAACSAADPTPSARYDGHYAGTRRSDQAASCGVATLQGTTSARVSGGHLSMALFNANTRLTGTVGDDGRVRASGLWPNPTGGFPGMTVLDGQIVDDALEGTATDFRCHTELRLHRLRAVPDKKKTP
jgi:hypothetical protein